MPSPRARTLLAALAGAGLLGLLVAYAGPASVLDALLSASPTHLALGLLAYALFFLARGLRWRTLLSSGAPDVRLVSTTSATAVGWLANSILPLKGGDLLRAALLAKRENISVGESTAIVALERVLDLLGLAALAAVGLALIPGAALPSWMGLALEVAWILPLLCIAALVLLVALRERALRLVAATLAPLGRPGRSLLRFVETAVEGVAALARRPRLLARLVPETLLVALLQAAVFAFLAIAFMPSLEPRVAFAGASLFLLTFVVSVTPGNVGTYEAGFSAVFLALGAPVAQALPAAILTHVTTTLIVALAGSAALLVLGATRGRIAPRPARIPTQGGGT